MNYILGVCIFLVVSENQMIFQAAGAVLFLMYISLAIANGWSFISYRYIRSAALTSFPLYGAVLLSMGCMSSVYATVGTLLLKMTLVYLAFSITPPSVVAKAFIYAIWGHTLLFILHILFLSVGAGNLWEQVTFIDTQTEFQESSYVSFRATGIFDEPSLFGMTILALALSNYLITGSVKGIVGPLFSFSLPTMVYAVFIRFIDSLRKPGVVKYAFLLVVPIVSLLLYQFAADRESQVKLSPLMLRINHFILFFQSDKLFTGNGFCSAYGKFDLAMSKEELRQLYLGNFKDAGQVLFIADRIGLIGFSVYILLLFRALPIYILALVVFYLALTKVPYFSFAGIMILASMASFVEDRYYSRDLKT